MIRRIRPAPNLRGKPAPSQTAVRTARGGISLLDAVADLRLFAPWFSKNPASWQAWFAVIAAIFGLPMTDDQLAIYRKVTGRQAAPTQVASEVWLIVGRRGGKSFILALIAVYLACFHSVAEYLAPGERATVMIIAADRKQGRVILRYIAALLKGVPLLAKMIEREVNEGFDLNNQITIEIATANFRSVRGYANCAILFDELAFVQSDEGSASPDHEILAALRPSMASIPTALLLCASSPYARRGALFDAHRLHYGRDHDPVLVVQADTRTLNPTIRQSFIDAEYEKDPASASAEYGAQFRVDIEQFVGLDTVMACVSAGITERAVIPGIKYSAFVDPSGGSADSFTLAVAHLADDGMGVLDPLREVKPKFSPDEVVKEFAEILKGFGITEIIGDRYAGIWPVERFKVHGIEYSQNAKAKSEIYAAALPMLNSRRVDLLDNARLISQFVGLERRTTRGTGRDVIDHQRGQHDDLVNAAAGALTNLLTNKYNYDVSLAWVGGDDDGSDWQAAGLMNHILAFGGGRGPFR
jgi:hypothetical protein